MTKVLSTVELNHIGFNIDVKLLRAKIIDCIKMQLKSFPKKKVVLYENDVFITHNSIDRFITEVTMSGVYVNDEREGTHEKESFKNFSVDLLLLISKEIYKNRNKI